MFEPDEAHEKFASGRAHAAEAAREISEAAAEAAKEWRESVARGSCQWCDNALDRFGRNPWPALVAAVLTGAVLGLLMRPRACAPQLRRAEQDAFC